MRKYFALALFILFAVGISATTYIHDPGDNIAIAADPINGGLGNIQFHCPPENDPAHPGQKYFRQVDPMISFGVAQSSHLHQFMRAGVTSTTTIADLKTAAFDGSCFIKSNRSLWWWSVPMAPIGTPVPAGGQVQPDGRVAVGAVNFRYYDRNISSGAVVSQFPANGFKQIIGNPTNTSDYGSQARWQCINGALTSPPLLWMPNENTHGTYNGKAYSCAAPATLQLTERDGNTCWNGTQTGPGMGGTDGPANARSHKEPCDAAHPKRLPVLDAVLDFPHAALTPGTRLSSDPACTTVCIRPGLTAHMDSVELFVNDAATGQSAQQRVTDMCLNNVSPPLPANYPKMDPNGLTCQEVDSPADGQPAGTGTIWVTTRPPVPLGQQGPNKSIPAVTH